MTTYRFHLRPSGRTGRNKGSLFIRIIHLRKSKDISCGYKVYSDEWNAREHRILLPDDNPERRRELLEYQKLLQADIDRLDGIVKTLNARGPYTTADICRQFETTDRCDTLLTFTARLGGELRANDQVRTARAYHSAAKSIVRYNSGKDLRLADINSALIRGYEQHLLERGLKMNTIAFYMRNLRAVYYRAVKLRIIAEQLVNPFADVFTGIYATRRRALDLDQLNELAALERSLTDRLLKAKQQREYAKEQAVKTAKLRDAILLFLFAYHARGMSFIDVAYLRKTDMQKNVFIYKRKKTGMLMEVKITKPMRRIINHFQAQTKGSPYVFPIISDCQHHRLGYENGLNIENKLLKEAAAIAGIKQDLTFHVARHTWATTAKRMGYSIMVISEGMGHRDVRITIIYLASFERSVMDELSTRMSGVLKAA